jgi:hypothetical protein
VKIFICWSGTRGEAAASALETWLKSALGDDVTPKVSHNIEKGTSWFEQLRDFLDESGAGLLCLTPEALRSPWVSFEAGALSRALGGTAACSATGGQGRGRLFTFLWGVDAGEVSGPLAAFQSTVASDERDVFRLCRDLAASIREQDGLGPTWRPPFEDSWDKVWKELRNGLALVPSVPLSDVWPEFPTLFRRKTFEEETLDCVTQRWLERYEGARNTLAAMIQRRPAVEQACRGYVVDLYRELERAVDSYAMALSTLLAEDSFDLDVQGRVQVDPPGLAAACETRRRRIRHLVAVLGDPDLAPFFNQAVQFDAAETFAERKNIIHNLTPAVEEVAERSHRLTPVQRGTEPSHRPASLPDGWHDDAFCFDLLSLALEAQPPARPGKGPAIDLESEWRRSDWPLDRIMYGIFLKKQLRLSGEASTPDHLVETCLQLAETELEKTRAGGRRTPLMPLHYCLGPLAHLREPDAIARERVRALLDGVLDLLTGRKARNRPVRVMALQIERSLFSARAFVEATPAAKQLGQPSNPDQPRGSSAS